ncbi:MAG: UDP-N-acetylmuramoyl-tripeptide--D-alanyl-D-alanine ligase [Verrucomicrobia bacterium]|nr:MAG: UDP-N-acetylmuramoyl-tripeptide--D-alanyl-D-alanine ligase [Verrucomicrobiota bacterium]
MKPISARELAPILGATLVAGDADACVSNGVGTDTRKLPTGCAFFALKGENFDGNAYAPHALEQGAAVAVVSAWPSDAVVAAGHAVLLVPDALTALQQLAHWWRSQLSLHVVGLTGSNGKTSTKDFTAAVLRQKLTTHATRGNLNNHIGLPLTVLETTPDHQAAVYEMGMNHAGEIAPLAAIARPQIAIITNIGSSHIEFLGSRENIAREKASIAAALNTEETLILPHDCDFMELITSLTRARIMTTGGPHDLVRASQLTEQAGGTKFLLEIDTESAWVDLPVPGRHMVANALLAAAAGHLCGLDVAAIARGLEQASLTSGRLRRFERKGMVVIDDTYNANPESMIAALQTLAREPIADGARRFAVLGRMGELGEHAAEGGRRVGCCAQELALELVTVGDEADLISRHAGETARHYATQEQTVEALQRELRAGDVVLFKGSRSAKMEQVMNQIFPND